jgi:hypothetical protein
MDHSKIKYYLPDFLEQILPDEEYIEIERHINNCNDCNEYYFRLRGLIAKVEELPAKIDPPTDLWEDLFKIILKKKNYEEEGGESRMKSINEKSSRKKGFSFKDLFKKK